VRKLRAVDRAVAGGLVNVRSDWHR